MDSVTNISNELYERKIRENNIIIYGVPESASNNRFEVYAEDLQITRDKLNNIKPDLAITKIIRLGKKFDNKPRPIKVILDSPIEVNFIFKNRNKLPNNRIKLDYTPLQQKHMTKIYKELEDRKNNGEIDLTLKFVHNIPKIVKLESKPTIMENTQEDTQEN